MKHTYTKLAIAMLIATSGAAYAAGTNFSNLSIGTVTNLTIGQTGNGNSRISNGNALSVDHTSTSPSVARGATAARGVTFTEANDNTGAFAHTGTLTTLSLLQSTTTAGEANENSITGALYTASGTVNVAQTGNNNQVDMQIGSAAVTGSSPVAAVTPATTIAITQFGSGNQTELIRTAGDTNSDTINSYGSNNAVFVTGSATGTNTVVLNLGTSAAATSSGNQAYIVQSGSGQTLKALVTGSDNVLDLNQTGSSGILKGSDGHTATINGSTNRFYLAQSGSANTATIDVLGSTNNVDVSQSGATTAATLNLNGSGNDINITQSGATTVASLNLASTNATVAVTQSTASASYSYIGTVPTGGSITVTQ